MTILISLLCFFGRFAFYLCVTNLHDFVLRWREENNRNDGSKILEDMVDYMQVAFQVIMIMVMVMMVRSW